ncbi:hypothetical protein [Rhizobium sp. BR 362]|uniref:hypothetical protein n=1 Tax=Rhizobium sp. BR 362 TaxID=3040670 RepID=UPI002F42BF6D
MTMKSMLVVAIVGFTGLILSSCVDDGSLYRTSGYSPGYYSGGAIFIGGGDHYRYRYDRNHHYRTRYPITTITDRAGRNIGVIVRSISTVVRVDINALYPSTKT